MDAEYTDVIQYHGDFGSGYCRRVHWFPIVVQGERQRCHQTFAQRGVHLCFRYSGVSRSYLRLWRYSWPRYSQGFWPDGLYTPPSYDAMIYDLGVLKSLGFNMLRKHIKVETDLFYRACDEMGLLVIQDMPALGVNNRVSNPNATGM